MIRNTDALLSHGSVEGRRIALDVIEHACRAVHGYDATRKAVRLEDEVLTVTNRTWPLAKIRHLYVLGAGKASISIAEALEDILSHRIEQGVVIVKRGQKKRLNRIRVLEASHPVPDAASVRGARAVLDIAARARMGDLVVCIFTGGSSALMTLPADGLSLADTQTLTEVLLNSGATIREINAVRKHVSAIKGGRLAQQLHPATIVNLTVSDVVGDWEALDCITGPTVPDASTFQDARSVLTRYDLWEHTPRSIHRHLTQASEPMETPKDLVGVDIHTVMLATNRDACNAATRKAEELGYESMVLSTMIEGESREVGVVLAGIALEVEKAGCPIHPPCVLVSGGETTVTVRDEHGQGGPNLELVTSLALRIQRRSRITAAAVGTDGTDGPTDAAGGIVDGDTIRRADHVGINVVEELKRHNTLHVLDRLGDAVYTGITGTNVMDLRVIVVTE